MLINFTTYKAEYAGGTVELVNPRNTSKQCSVCGNTQPMPLSQRTYRCSECGAVMDRDHNAAINILNKHVGTDCVELTPVESLA
ncbi:MAG: transposase, partial [Euryarchaeota archaeon]|nr:transposase [Euryarchaeota archaeon]